MKTKKEDGMWWVEEALAHAEYPAYASHGTLPESRAAAVLFGCKDAKEFPPAALEELIPAILFELATGRISTQEATRYNTAIDRVQKAESHKLRDLERRWRSGEATEDEIRTVLDRDKRRA